MILEAENDNTFKRIVLNFPILKKFKAIGIITWLNVDSVTFQVPLLEIVDISVPRYYSYPNPVSTSRYTSDNCTVNLRTSHLKNFSYVGHPSQFYILSKSFSDVNSSARIVFSGVNGIEEEKKQWGF